MHWPINVFITLTINKAADLTEDLQVGSLLYEKWKSINLIFLKLQSPRHTCFHMHCIKTVATFTHSYTLKCNFTDVALHHIITEASNTKQFNSPKVAWKFHMIPISTRKRIQENNSVLWEKQITRQTLTPGLGCALITSILHLKTTVPLWLQ